jgi:regulator of CtrA degradation
LSIHEPLYIQRAYADTMKLLIEARNYAAYANYKEKDKNGGIQTIKILHHSMIITSRLTHLMAWILAQRAVNSGEIAPFEVNTRGLNIPDIGICTCPTGNTDDALPQGLRDLLNRSYSLYWRVLRIEIAMRERLANS